MKFIVKLSELNESYNKYKEITNLVANLPETVTTTLVIPDEMLSEFMTDYELFDVVISETSYKNLEGE